MSSALRQKDAASLPQDDSPEEDPKHQIGDSDCGVCRNLRSSGPEYINTTYAKLQRAAADGCELCKILQQVSEAICTSAGTIIWSTNAVYVQKRLWEVEECAAYMGVELLREGGTSQNSLRLRITQYTTCTDTAVRYTGNALFYAASGMAYIAYEYIRSGRIGCSLTNRRGQLPLAFHDFESYTRRKREYLGLCSVNYSHAGNMQCQPHHLQSQ